MWGGVHAHWCGDSRWRVLYYHVWLVPWLLHHLPLRTQKLISDSLYFAPGGTSQGGKLLIFNTGHRNSKVFPVFLGPQWCPDEQSWPFQISDAYAARPESSPRHGGVEGPWFLLCWSRWLGCQPSRPTLVPVHCLSRAHVEWTPERLKGVRSRSGREGSGSGR